MKYNVTITEILEKTIEIEAENETNAIDIARDKYNKEEVILTADDLALISVFINNSEFLLLLSFVIL